MLGSLAGGSEMDPETSSAIEALSQDLGHLRGEISELRDETVKIRGDMREMREELMRHAMVLTDSVRDDIRLVAEGLATVSAKLDALRR